MNPWMGGLFRFVPKLWFMIGLELWGVEPWPYRLMNIALHAVSALTLAVLVGRVSGTRWLGTVTGLLFALGFGAYGRAVLQISNLTMVLSLCALLIGILLLQWRHVIWASLAFLVAVFSHELAWLLVVLVPLVWWFLGREKGVYQHRLHHLRLAIGGSIIVIAVASLLPGFIFETGREMVRLIGGSVLPVNTLPGSYATSGVLEKVNRLLGGIISVRWWIGLVPLALLLIAVPRLRRPGLVSVVWILAAALPAAALMAMWNGEYIDRRYLYFPSVGLAALGAQFLYARKARRVWTGILLSLACCWSILWVGLGLWKMTRDAADPVQQVKLEEFSSEMRALNPEWGE